jgi:hypothetical protein
LAVVVFVVLCAGVTWLELARTHALTVEIGPAMPLPDPEDWDNTLGNRYWHVDPEVTVRLKRGCEGIRLVTRARALSNGRPVPAWHAYLGAGGEEAPGRRSAGFVLRVRESAYGPAGYAVRFRATASCRSGGRRESASTTRLFQLPAASCFGGPLRVYDVDGAAMVTDADWDVPDTYPLRVGHLAHPGWEVDVPPRGRVVLGAPECNGFHAELGPGRHMTGGYASASRGAAFAGADARMTGDRHAGGVDVGATVEPIGFRCRTCPTEIPAKFATRSVSPTRSVVRVEAGMVRARATEGASALVRAGQQLSVVCSSQRRCRLTGLRRYEPGEAWNTPLRSGGHPFVRRLVTPAGARPPRSRLAPARSQIRLFVLPASSRVPEQLFVVWRRTVHGRPTGPTADEVDQQGVLLWQVAPARGRSVWRLLYSRRLDPYVPTAVDIGDMSGDGHPEVLYAGLQGSGNCGLWRLLVTTSGGIEEALRDANCETGHELASGVFHRREIVGPCPFSRAPAHCYGGVRDTQMRWDGRRLVAVRTVVRCLFPRLDPTRGCRARS